LHSLLDIELLQWPIICAVYEVYFFARVIASSSNSFLYDDVEFIRYDLVLRRVLETGKEGRDVDERECGRKCRDDGGRYLQNGQRHALSHR
jgi:hypothetical protein